jgi:hypothetical protein
MLMLRACVVVWGVGEVVSVVLTTKAKVPAVLGVPEIVPVALSVRPVGSKPEAMDHVYGAVPPVTARLWE